MTGTNVANEMSVMSEVNMSEIALKLSEQLSLQEVLVNNFSKYERIEKMSVTNVVS